MRINNNNLQQQFNDYLNWCEINNLQVKDAKSLIKYVKQQQQNFINKLEEGMSMAAVENFQSDMNNYICYNF